MLSVTEALAAILRHATPLEVEHVSLFAALDRILAAEIASGIDSPPFDKALMDGFAVQSTDTAGGSATLTVIETVMAGEVPARAVESGQAIRIMTGAPLPAGADAVVPIEKTMAAPQSGQVHLGVALRPGANVLHRGESMRAGERIFAAGQCLRPQDLGVLAELGVASVPVRRRPRVAILATGDELVPPESAPGPGQIRNSNESLLSGLVTASGGDAVPLGIARDAQEELRAQIDEALACDMLLLSGGVSAGDLDLVPGALKAAGVRQVFHKVNLKPGKPVWFGVKRLGIEDQMSGEKLPSSLTPDPRPLTPGPCLVLGLPGNPVSALVCFELFAKTAIGRLLGSEPAGPQSLTATFAGSFENRGDRPVYHPAQIGFDDEGRTIVSLVRWAGSGDLRATVRANGVAVFGAGRSYATGDRLQAVLWSGSDMFRG